MHAVGCLGGCIAVVWPGVGVRLRYGVQFGLPCRCIGVVLLVALRVHWDDTTGRGCVQVAVTTRGNLRINALPVLGRRRCNSCHYPICAKAVASTKAKVGFDGQDDQTDHQEATEVLAKQACSICSVACAWRSASTEVLPCRTWTWPFRIWMQQRTFWAVPGFLIVS